MTIFIVVLFSSRLKLKVYQDSVPKKQRQITGNLLKTNSKPAKTSSVTYQP